VKPQFTFNRFAVPAFIARPEPIKKTSLLNMRRRLFLTSGSAATLLAMTGCGGGGGGATAGTAAATGIGIESSSAAASASGVAGLPVGVVTNTSASAGTAAPSTAGAAGTTAPAGTDSAASAAGNTAESIAATEPVAPQSYSTGYNFGSRLDRYVAGTVPSVGSAEMDAVLSRQYDAWKAARIQRMDNVAPGGLVVKFSHDNVSTVSEAMGYGMLLAVVFAGHDPQARQLFDGLLAVVRARPSYGVVESTPVGRYLMEWRLLGDGSSGGEGWNAMDGDLDIAMALLMAHRQWGSGGTWNYFEEAKATINALKVWNMSPDGTTKGLRLAHVSRTSDYMIGHFRAFAQATGDKFWDKAIKRSFQLIKKSQKQHSSVGLMPDFLMNTDSDATPSSGYIGDGNDKEGFYWWNACRNPWRFAADYVLSGDRESHEATATMIDFFQQSSGGDPVNIGTGYALDGTKLAEGNSPAFSGPICAGACVDSRYQAFADALWKWNATHLTTGYYDSEIQLLSMVVASGNWWSTARG